MSLVPAERVERYAAPATVRLGAAAPARPLAATRVQVAAVCVVLFLISLYPRAINVGGYLTTDEGNWMGRTALFTRGLIEGDPSLTYQSGHPGVMTMWLSLIGMGSERALGLVEYVRPDGLEKAPAYLETLRLARRPFTVLTSLGVVGIALLTWRLFGRGPGLLAGILLGLEPFFLAHSVVAHVDSNATVWMTVCLLSAVIYFWTGGTRGYIALSGVAAGLAFLSKAPSAFLPLFIPLVALGGVVQSGHARRPAAWRRLAVDAVLWGLLALMVAMALWPSFRTDPIGTLRQMIEYTEAVGGADHENFFMGQPTGDPGALYYVVCLGFRLTPVTLLGLVLLGTGLLPIGVRAPAGWAARSGLLVVYCVLFIGMMSLAPKKFDRYLLPIFPVIEVLAAIGFWLALRRLPRGIGGRALPAALLVLGVAQIAPAALVYPYYLAYYDPLFGGGPAARRAIVVGWGEGLDVVMSYLNQKPDAERLTVAGFYPRVMSAQFKGSILSPKQYDEAMADYIVLYVNAVQRDLADRLRTVTRGKRTEMIVRINGIEYARLYPIPPPPGRNAAGTQFGGAVRLERSFFKSVERPNLKSDNLNPGDTLLLTLRWVLTQPVAEDLTAVTQLVERRSGRVVAEHAAALSGPSGPTSTMRENELAIETHRIDLPDVVGQYSLVVGVRRPNGEWLPVTNWPDKLTADARRGNEQVVVDSVDAQ